MKKFLLFLVFLLISSSSSFAQIDKLLTPMFAKDGIATAQKSVDSISKGAQLAAIGTISGDIPISSTANLTLKFNLGTSASDKNHGKGTLWFYFFKGKTSTGADTVIAYGVGKTILGTFMTLALPAGAAPNIGLDSVLSAQWMNSDSLVVKLNSSSVYSAFHTANPDSLPNFVGLGKNAQSPFGMSSTWIFQMNGANNQTLSCFVNAERGADLAMCIVQTLNGVADNNAHTLNAPMKVFPNPASSSVILQIHPSIIRENGRLFLYNSLGERIFEFSNPPNSPEQTDLYIGLSNFANGAYFLRYESSAGVFTTPVVIEK